MVFVGVVTTVLALAFIGIAIMAAANDFKEDAKIMALVAIACAILGTGFLR